MSETIPVQLRLGFTAPTKPVTVSMSLSGLFVICEPRHGSADEVFAYLSDAGADPVITDGGDVRFPISRVHMVRELPNQVHILCDPVLHPLVELARKPSDDQLPATLSCSANGALVLSWFDGIDYHDEPFAAAAAAALLHCEASFVATHQAWDVLKQVCQVPVLAGRAQLNLDGYVEIVTTKPQLVEVAPLPGLFRLDETHFGLSLAYADQLANAPGFVWQGRTPRPETGPSVFPSLPVALSAHASQDLRELVDGLAAYRAQAVVWESGLGRRVFCLAALEVLDAWPLLIVTPPWGVWMWQRHLDLFARSHALTHDRADAHIVTYHDVAQRSHLPTPQAIIFDDMLCPQARTPEVVEALHRMDALQDVYRIGLTHSWPEDLSSVTDAMSLLRPREFRTNMSLAARYPVHTEKRAAEHIAAYTSLRRTSDPDTDRTQFRRSSVIVLPTSEAQQSALNGLGMKLSTNDVANVLAESLEIVSAGPAHAVSPKIAMASTCAREAVHEHRKVAIVTRHSRSATLIRATLRPLRVDTFDASDVVGLHDTDAQVVVLRFDRQLPDLRMFDEVIVVDYPFTASVLENAVGDAGDSRGPTQVTVLHTPDTSDDRLAMLAARRRELGAVLDPGAPLTINEMAYLLEPRN